MILPVRGIFVFVAGEAEGDGSPEEAGAHLHGQVALVVGVPDPDVAAVLDHAGVGGGLHAQGFEGAEDGLDLFAALDLHGHGHGVLGIDDGNHKGVAELHGLRRGVETPVSRSVRQPGMGVSTCLVWPVTWFFSSRMDLPWA
jgi:hypothetical protein